MEFNNNTLNTLNQITQNSFSAINSSFEDLDIYLSQNFEFVNDSIDNLGLEITSQFVILSSEIENSSLDIQNSIYAINSTISNLTQELSNYVFLVNNSIYTAVLDSYSALEIQNNLISGNLSIVFEMNEELTALFEQTFFSEYLDWTNASISADYIANQTQFVDFVSEYSNTAVEILLKYNNTIETITMAALADASIRIPSSNVQYSIRSIETGETLEEWTPIDNNTIKFGFDEREYNIDEVNFTGYSAVEIFLIIAIIIVVIVSTVFIIQRIRKTSKSRIKNEEPQYIASSSESPIDKLRKDKRK
jgi:hypothetical protein